MDYAKISAIADWPTLSTIFALHGFLGLAGYYLKFVRNFGIIARPLTDLLRKDNFKWSTAVDNNFSALKKAMWSVPVLTFPDFTKPLTIECDAFNNGTGAVLSQDHHPIKFLSKLFEGKIVKNKFI
ncbi:uncharacterized mitochondrial protein AtMg00860-like [Pyrus communis]|uniref:uncharacterized mitochondrial protein AtMg00860-like n=1 Tax=Pyrus communis TaxID=23211 RepID=UPI0035BFFBE5